MRHPRLMALVTLLVLPGCVALPFLASSPSYPDQAAKVKVMTNGFSLSRNTKLASASRGLGKSLQALQAALIASDAPPADGPADAGVPAARKPGAYALAGVQTMGKASFVYDNTSKELTAIKGNHTEIAFDTQTKGSDRTWQAKLKQSPDKSSGNLSITVHGTWKDADAPGSNEFKLFQNQVPDALKSAEFQLHVTPQGNDGLAVAIEGQLDQPHAVPGTPWAVPGHWTLKATLPGLAFDWESSVDPTAKHSKASLLSHLMVDAGGNAQEHFQLTGAWNEDAGTGTLALVNLGAKLKLVITGTQANPGEPASFDSSLMASDGNKAVGKVTMDPKRPGHAIVTLDGGTKQDWELFSANQTLPMMPWPAPVPSSAP